jgi:mRNA interferase MazF
MARRVSRGEIWMYEFRSPDKLRPVLVLSRPAALEVLHTAMVAPITSTVHDAAFEVAVGTEEGLKGRSAVNLDHVQTVEQTRLRRFVGSLPPPKMAEVCRALAIATGCG